MGRKPMVGGLVGWGGGGGGGSHPGSDRAAGIDGVALIGTESESDTLTARQVM